MTLALVAAIAAAVPLTWWALGGWISGRVLR